MPIMERVHFASREMQLNVNTVVFPGSAQVHRISPSGRPWKCAPTEGRIEPSNRVGNATTMVSKKRQLCGDN
jgi:hypothetical protein